MEGTRSEMTDIQDAGHGRREPVRFWRQFVALFLLGLVGVLSLIPMVLVQLDAPAAVQVEVPDWVIVLVSLVQSAVLVAVAVAVGVLFTHKVDLTSLVADRVRRGTDIWPRLRTDVPIAVGLGLTVAVAIMALDSATAPLAGLDVTDNPLSWFPQLVLGMLYGGITEELLLRWGLMTVLVWAGHRLFGRNHVRPSEAVMWVSILLTAVVFGLGHLPALSVYADLTPFLVVRTVALNALGGIVFGWLYWRRSLEAAMVSHASVHVGFAVLGAVLGSLS